MSFFTRIFGKKEPAHAAPDVVFGRYTDAYKTPAQQAAWERSLVLFDDGNPLAAYRELFTFLRDEATDNLQWGQEAGALTFEFQQGSRHIRGVANHQKVWAESRIAQADDLNVGFLRRLVEQNFSLKFCRYALTPDNCLAIVFDSHTADGAPLKILHALRELALNADKQDDLLLDEFRSLRPAEQRAGTDVPTHEKQAKYNYLRQQIETAFAALDEGRPDPHQYPGGYVYLLLSLAFRLDYLVQPQGFMMDTLEQVYNTYFNKDERSPAAKVQALRRELQRLLDRSQEALFAEMYRTKSTFGINPAVGHERVRSLIEGELPKMDWHLQQRHPEVITMAIPQYAVGYALFHYAPPPPIKALLHLLYQVTEAPFFAELGFQTGLTDTNGQPRQTGLERAVRDLGEQYRTAFPKFRPDPTQLRYDSMPVFARSYLEMVARVEL
jgi:hypothetical protein